MSYLPMIFDVYQTRPAYRQAAQFLVEDFDTGAWDGLVKEVRTRGRHRKFVLIRPDIDILQMIKNGDYIVVESQGEAMRFSICDSQTFNFVYELVAVGRCHQNDFCG